MVGADPADLERCRPLFDAMASEIFLAGPVGMGHLFKLINQLVCIANLAVIAEAFAFAEAQGADLDLLYAVLQKGSAASYMLEGQVPDFLAGKYKPRFIMRLAKKDLDLSTDLADTLGLPLPLGAFVRQFFQIGMRKGLGEENESAVFEVWRDLMREGMPEA
jgi:3-hydroxyisobutyrate dehydrogenase-like beta-hydroxyacid dehydrogenase